MKNLCFYRGYTFEFIKALSDTVLDMINAVYHDKPLVLSGLYIWVYQGSFWHCIRHDKYRYNNFIAVTYCEKLVTHHRSTNEADCCLHARNRGTNKGICHFRRMKQKHHMHYLELVVFYTLLWTINLDRRTSHASWLQEYTYSSVHNWTYLTLAIMIFSPI